MRSILIKMSNAHKLPRALTQNHGNNVNNKNNKNRLARLSARAMTQIIARAKNNHAFFTKPNICRLSNSSPFLTTTTSNSNNNNNNNNNSNRQRIRNNASDLVFLNSVRLRSMKCSSANSRTLTTDAFDDGVECVLTTSALASGNDEGSKNGQRTAMIKKANQREENKSERVEEMIDLQPPKGTRDFPPEEMRKRTWLFDNFRATAQRFGFEEFDAPVLESERLFTRKAGEEIQSQLYNFLDKGDRRVSLRPELTPSLARLIMQKGKSLALPAKWFAIGQCWRYERMTRGRRREHYQWNMDIIGVAGVEAEVELLSAICSFFESVGISNKDVGIKVNSRKVLAAAMKQSGVPEEIFANVCVVVDKIEKLPREKIIEELNEVGLSTEATENVLKCMEIKTLEGLKELLGEDDETTKEMEKLFELAEAYGIKDWLVFDASVVRGLAYYTGVVFEGFDRRGELRAICGGGRYDGLISTLGGEPTSMVGFGFGDAVIVELLKDRGLFPEDSLKTMNVDDVVYSMDKSCRAHAIKAAQKLRLKGRKVDLVLDDDKKQKWTFKHCERVGAKRLITIGLKDLEAASYSVKSLDTREEVSVSLENL